MKEYDEHHAGPNLNSVRNCSTTKYPGSFQKLIPYIEDAYERKEDMRRLDYQRRAALILDKGSPFKSSVKQHGTFDPYRTTYGSDKKFDDKIILKAEKPHYGPFRKGDPPKVGHEKALNRFP